MGESQPPSRGPRVQPPTPMLATPEFTMNVIWAILLIVVILLLVGAVPAWPYSRGWGYYPAGGLGLILIVLLIVLLLRPAGGA